VLEREDEIQCAVGGCNFLLKTITHEAFTYSSEKGCQFVPCSCESLLLAAIDSGAGAGCSVQ
jgi:pantothenate kinase